MLIYDLEGNLINMMWVRYYQIEKEVSVDNTTEYIAKAVISPYEKFNLMRSNNRKFIEEYIDKLRVLINGDEDIFDEELAATARDV